MIRFTQTLNVAELFRRTGALASFLAACLTLHLLAPSNGFASELKIVVSLNALKSMVNSLGQGTVQVQKLLSGTADPHNFELKPSHLVSLTKADLIVVTNPAFDGWAERLEPNLKKKVFWLSTSSQNSSADIHYWLDPLVMVGYADAMRDKLCDLSSVNCLTYKSNHASYSASLKNLNAQIEKRVSLWKQKSFAADHPAWQAFAERYALKQIAVLRESESRQTSARETAALLRQIKEGDVKVFIVEKSAEGSVTSEFLKESGLKTAVLDSFGEENDSYNQLLLKNIAVLEPLMSN